MSLRLSKLSYVATWVVLLAVILAGYLAFRTFVSIPDWGVFNLYTLAIVAGVASFFSPCAFPLLPSYFSFYHLGEQPQNPTEVGVHRILRGGVVAALGIITFNLVLGLLIAVVGISFGQELSISGAEPNAFVRLVRGSLGVTLLVLGIGQLASWNLKPTFIEALAYHTRPKRDRQHQAAASLYLYGFGYNAAGMGCTGPILAGLLLTAVTSGSFGTAFTAFVIFSLTMGILMIFLSGLIATSQQTLVTRLKVAAPKIKQGAAILMIVVGVFNLYFAFNLSLFLRLFFPSS